MKLEYPAWLFAGIIVGFVITSIYYGNVIEEYNSTIHKCINITDNCIGELEECIYFAGYWKNLSETREKIIESYSKERILKEIPFEALVEFLREDDTDKIPYSEDFNCFDYTNTLLKHAYMLGYDGCAVQLEFNDSGHMIAGFHTDRGFVYVEPQDDTIIYDLEVGDDYCEKVGWFCNWTIQRIRVAC